MDLATIIGILAGLGVVLAAIFMGGDFMSFVDVGSVMIVIGGAIAATVIRFTFGAVVGGFRSEAQRYQANLI
jgi:chemotaxis protein MotA